MLVLTRKRGEQIRLGENIVITVLGNKGKSVRIGIEAPQELRVVRGELELPTPPAAEEPSEVPVVNRGRAANGCGGERPLAERLRQLARLTPVISDTPLPRVG